MTNYKADPIYRGVLRRNKNRRYRQREKERFLHSLEIVFYWFECALLVEVFICWLTYMEVAEKYGPEGEWTLIWVFLIAMVRLTLSRVKRIKKSPRNGNSSRGHR